ncbi:3-dehydroquinate synthase [Striga asiatica]|uniref:3-dehydroquinate synthase n=1 Tax=Striga asiatica TaxID=4170 RepID=A0A5A7Q4T7_STRAF|nr:3-dehydroquinate synthase [Striga asiatica]
MAATSSYLRPKAPNRTARSLPTFPNPQQTLPTSLAPSLTCPVIFDSSPNNGRLGLMENARPLVDVDLGKRRYPIYIGLGLLSQPEIDQRHVHGKQVLVVTNSTVAPLYLDKTIWSLIERNPNIKVESVILPVGEKLKKMVNTLKLCYGHSFYQPQCVLIDTDALNILPDRESASGLAELIKYGLIRDAEYFEWQEKNMDALLARDPNVFSYAIKRSYENKIEVVSLDEKESGLRATFRSHVDKKVADGLLRLILLKGPLGNCVFMGDYARHLKIPHFASSDEPTYSKKSTSSALPKKATQVPPPPPTSLRLTDGIFRSFLSHPHSHSFSLFSCPEISRSMAQDHTPLPSAVSISSQSCRCMLFGFCNNRDFAPKLIKVPTCSSHAVATVVEVDLGDRSYPVYIGPDLLDQPEIIQRHVHGKQALVVTSTRIAPLYLNKTIRILTEANPGIQVETVFLPDGEKFKNMESVMQVFDKAIESRMDRRCTFIALGGGLIGDMCGYAASSYLRGVNYIQIPTTAMSQVDSSVGGKTAINHGLGKNLIGTIYQPKCVLVDTDTLNSLPERYLASGLAEVI